MRRTFRILIPVQSLAIAQPRLEIAAGLRAALALAFAQDTISSALECASTREVIVVSPDPEVRAAAERLGASAWVSDERQSVTKALQAILSEEDAGSAVPTAVLVSDVPAMEPDELFVALARTSSLHPTVVVNDLAGRGKTLLASRSGLLRPHLRRDSRTPLSQGCVLAVGLDLPGLRCDVDTMEGLRLATYIGVGRHTSALLRSEAADGLRTDLCRDILPLAPWPLDR